MKVKICGIRRQQDADAAVEAGVDALGFIFSDKSPRYIDIKTARSIIQSLPPFVTPVGVFVNESRWRIVETIVSTGIKALQLHGDENPDEAKGYAVPVYKAFRVGSDFSPASLSKFGSSAYLLDTSVDGSFGGTGRTFDWKVAVAAKRYGRIILSGGLSPENVGEAVRAVVPYAIDANSGVEKSPGFKDRARIQQLVFALRRMEESQCLS